MSSSAIDDVRRRDEYVALISDLRSTLTIEIEKYRSLWTPNLSEEQRAVYMWTVALLTSAWDVSNAATQCCLSNDMRAARILDRSLSEYAYGLYFYCRYPDKALESGLQYEIYLRKILKPTGQLQGDMTDEEFASLQSFISSGATRITYESTRKIREAAVSRFVVDQKDVDSILNSLDSEYAVSSGYAHGSQGILGDVFRNVDGTAGYHPHSTWFSKERLLVRIATHLVLTLVAAGSVDPAGMLMRSLVLLADDDKELQNIQVYTENVMFSVLGYALGARNTWTN